jgi:hypothetical protein
LHSAEASGGLSEESESEMEEEEEEELYGGFSATAGMAGMARMVD